MSCTKIVTFILTLIIANINGHNNTHHYKYLAQILKYNNNLFRNVHENAQKIVNTMFDSLDLVEEFSKDPKIKLLLTMHYDLNSKAEKNFEMYDLLRNASAIKDNKTAININHLDEIVKEISTYRRTTVIEPQYVTHHKFSRFKFNKTKKHIHKRKFPKATKKRPRKRVHKKLNKDISSESQLSADGELKIWKPDPWTSLEEEMFNNVTANRRIYGGKKTNIVSFPFIVSIHILNDFTCAGTIISKDLIITAASCLQLHYNNRFFRENPKTLFVRVGSDWLSRRGELVPALEIYFHPMYDPKSLHNNLAIIRLTRTLNLGRHKKAKIRRMLLDRGEGNLPPNTDQIKILGWGAKTSSQVIKSFDKLAIAKLSIYGIKECKEIYSSLYVTNNHFCAGYVSRGIGACNRDVGGPGFTDNLLIGVISFGSPVCGTFDSPTVFTRVGPYYDWIEEIMKTPAVRYGAPLTQTPANKIIIYFNTITTTNTPHVYPISTIRVRPILSDILRLRADDSKDDITTTTVSNQVTDADVVYEIDVVTEATVTDKPQDNTDHNHNINQVTNKTITFSTTTIPTANTKHASKKPLRFLTVSTSALPNQNENLKPDVRRFDETKVEDEFDGMVALDDANMTSEYEETKASNEADVKHESVTGKKSDDAKTKHQFDDTKVSDEAKLYDDANATPEFDDKKGKYTYIYDSDKGNDDVYNANDYG